MAASMKSPGKMSQSLQLDAPLQDDGFGANIGAGDLHSGGLFEGGGLFDEPTMGDEMPPVEEDSLRKSPGTFFFATSQSVHLHLSPLTDCTARIHSYHLMLQPGFKLTPASLHDFVGP